MSNTYNKSTIKFYKVCLLLLQLIFLTLYGCVQIGPDLVQAGRNEYNKVLAQTNDEEMLLNLVRLRYSDNSVIMQVSSVSTSFTWRQGINVDSQIFTESGNDNTNIGPGGNLDYAEQPTITYTPLAGADYVQKVLTPMEIDTLTLLSTSGWSLERLLRVTVNRMNRLENADNASGPTPIKAPKYQDFNHAAAILQRMQDQNAIVSGYLKEGEETFAGFRFILESQNTNPVIELSELLGLDPSAELIKLDTLAHLRRKDALGLEMRSLAGISFFLSHGVQVPEEDALAGVVRTTSSADGKPFNWNEIFENFFIVHSQNERPNTAAVAVNYRGKWFYIDDTDIQTKYTFMLLRQLTQLQGGKTQTSGPLLTLPVR